MIGSKVKMNVSNTFHQISDKRTDKKMTQFVHLMISVYEILQTNGMTLCSHKIKFSQIDFVWAKTENFIQSIEYSMLLENQKLYLLSFCLTFSDCDQVFSLFHVTERSSWKV